ncbi:MAG TPA: hypothetical protein PKW15_00090 [Alphaproteobacteria bacterium]|nr:hypothetical protein [Rhodospirillaceae bacterium]HRJ11623.1 hypothetical protein [Alphaproteobacteria bacterium]
MIKFDLSELPISPRQYQTIGITFLSVGILLLILGIVLAVMTESRRTKHASRVKVSAQECSIKIKALGLNSIQDGETLRIMDKDLTRGMELLASSSQAAALCPNWTLSSYCMGQACTPPGLSMTLQFGEIK